MKLQKDALILDLSYIFFSHFTLKKFNIYENQIISFNDAHFFYKAVFDGINFKNDVNFIGTVFYDSVGFNMTIFSKKTYFLKTIFTKKVSFRGSESKDIFHFTNCCFNKIDFIGSYFEKIDLLNLKAFEHNNLISLNKAHFENKESARIIKDHFERQNNITEANKYFAIEQNKYLEELEESIHENNYKDFLVIWLNKYVSFFGTDWMRPLLVIFIFGFFASFFYIVFSNTPTLFIYLEPTTIPLKDILFWTGGGFAVSIVIYLLYHYKEWKLLALAIGSYICLLYFSQDLRLITNDISKLVNPLNIFKGRDFFKDIAPYGMIVKLIMATLIYQFIMAFRQNTRRK